MWYYIPRYCQCAWQSWCWRHNRDCWACKAALSAGPAQYKEALQVLRVCASRLCVEEQELLAQWEADLNLSEAAAAAEAAAQEEARAEKKAEKKAAKKADKKAQKEAQKEAQKKADIYIYYICISYVYRNEMYYNINVS